MSSDYQHDTDYRLRNLHQAMDFTADGKPAVRVLSNIQGDIVIEGEVTIPGSVKVENVAGTSIAINDGDNAITVDGTVNIGTMPEVEIKNDTGNPISVSANTNSNSNTNPIWVKGTSDTSFFSPAQSDAFGRLRTSNPLTLFDSFHRYQDNEKISEYTAGTASSSHSVDSGSVLMSIGSASGDAIYKESTRVFAYQPGKSLLILQTFCLTAPKAGLRQRIGYFDVDNGLYLESAGTDVNFVRRSSASGQLKETRVPQSAWNTDQLDGTGPSGYTLDLSKTQILFTDVEWLGVGSVRMGFVIEGQFVICHIFHHANQTATADSDTTLPYMSTACLPVRAELENTSATASSSNFRLICTSVISEGGYELRGRAFSVGHRLNAPRTTTSQQTNQFIPVISIRLKSNRTGAIVVPKNFSIAPLVASNYEFRIVTSAVTTGGTWISAGDNSSVEYNLTATAVSSGTIRETGYIITTNQSATSLSLQDYPFEFQLERNTLSTPVECYEFVIEVATSGNQGSTVTSINWEEIT